MTTVDGTLEAIRSAAGGVTRRPVTVLGGGLAGLVAAYELEQLGYSVRLLEGRSALQGRVRTHRFADGTYGELGPMRIAIHHDYTRHYVGLCGLELRPFVTAHQNLNGFYDIAGVRCRMKSAGQSLYGGFDLSVQQREDEVPPKMLGRAVSDVVEGLTDSERASLRTPYLASDRLRALDAMPMSEFIRWRCGDSAAELIGSATGLEQMYDRSTMMLLRDALVSSGDGFDEIVGGMDRLPATLAGKLERTEVVTGACVRAIRRLADGTVEVAVERNGETTVETPETVVCTIPFSVLRQLDIDSAFSRSKLRAIRGLGYMSSVKVLLHCRERFWELREGIVGGASMSDRVWRMAYYPCDNVAVDREPVPAEERYNSMYGAYEGGRYTPRDPEVSEGPGVLLGSYTWGQDARRLGALPAEDRRDVVVRELGRLHPELAGDGMVDDHASMYWDTERWTSGSFAEPGPGDHTHFFDDVIRAEGGVHFAGEHASTDPGWMQGAIESGLRAVHEVVTGASNG